MVGDAYAMAASPSRHCIAREMLLDHLLDLLQHSPDVDRIESQMLLYDAGTLAKSFREAGFTLYMRLFMEFDIDRAGTPGWWLDAGAAGVYGDSRRGLRGTTRRRRS